jgi:predicted glycogen debranching enzyme
MTRRLLDTVVRPLKLPDDPAARTATLLDSEWLVTNGIGGYSSGSVAGSNTRRYHGLLVAALPNPFGRMVMVNQLDESVATASGAKVDFGNHTEGAQHLVSFRLEAGLPVWEIEADGVRVEKRILMPNGQNTVHVVYRLLRGASVQLDLRPSLHIRGYEESVSTSTNAPNGSNYAVTEEEGWLRITVNDALPPLRLRATDTSAKFVVDPQQRTELEFTVEKARGFADQGSLWSPGRFTTELRAESPVAFIASTEPLETASVLGATDAQTCEWERRRRLARSASDAVHDPIGIELVLAADQFIISPAGRVRDATRAKAAGDEIRTIIAGYHWFTDWGRDTMISLEGLALVTGREREAAFILRTFAHYVRDGLIPNMFPDGSNEGLYHTADASLWFFHAVERYAQATGDDELIIEMLPVMQSIIEAHATGTRYGIGMDPRDGLIRQGAEGYQLTWMDAKVDGWVVTPRRGKPVEINALWYNALCLTGGWTEKVRGAPAASKYREMAARARQSFNARFWNPATEFLYDVIDGEQGDQPECRPNQIIAISLENPVLDRDKWQSVIDVVESRLLTPVGLRSLAPGERDYKERYFGDLRARDAAYHQGTVWAWLIGPWIDAWLKLHPDDCAGARHFLDGLVEHLGTFGIGSIAEVFDATEPYTPRGCIAQAWSVAEVLRCWEKTAPANRG